MSRLLWFAAGAGATLYASAKARRAAEAVSVDGLRDRAQALALGARMVRDEVAQGRAEKEHELRERFGLAPVPVALGGPRPTPALPNPSPSPNRKAPH